MIFFDEELFKINLKKKDLLRLRAFKYYEQKKKRKSSLSNKVSSR